MPLKYPLPNFLIDFCGPRRDHTTFEFVNSEFISGERFIPGVESLHVVSEKDALYSSNKSYYNFENPNLIYFDQGHRPPKFLSKHDLELMTDFIVR